MIRLFHKSPTPGFTMWVSLIFIALGILLFAHNLGWIGHEAFSLLMAWHTLLILLGVYLLLHRRYASGIVLLLVGCWMLGSRLCLSAEQLGMLRGPLLLVLIGVLPLTRRYGRRLSRSERYKQHLKQRVEERHSKAQDASQRRSEQGFLYSENSLGSVRRVVLDEIFKGGRIRNYLGGTIIDLHRTSLADGETCIDLECYCGSVELHIPSEWNVRMECTCVCSGCEDNRWKATGPGSEKATLVLRGNITMGYLEIKD